MSEFKASGFRDEFGSGGPDLVGITTMTSPYYFVPPSGSTAERPESPPPGMLRFNTDIGRLEVWRNDHWATILGEQSATNSSRAFFGGGYTQGGSPNSNAIEYVSIQTTGNSIDFGDLTRANQDLTAFSSTTRGIWAGGNAPSVNTMDFITLASTGDATDFGDLLEESNGGGSVSDSTRGVIVTGGIPSSPGYRDHINFVTMASTGDATDFGDVSEGQGGGVRGMNNRTRGVFHLGGTAPANGNNTLEYITIQSTGNSVDFGDLTQGGSDGKRTNAGTFSNSIRGVVYGGYGPSPAIQTVIQYITISTTGNSLDFGDLSESINRSSGACDSTRGLMGGGNPSSARNNIDFITISTLGNAQDFGHFTVTKHSYYDGACSNAHGGL